MSRRQYKTSIMKVKAIAESNKNDTIKETTFDTVTINSTEQIVNQVIYKKYCIKSKCSKNNIVMKHEVKMQIVVFGRRCRQEQGIKVGGETADLFVWVKT